MKVVVTVNGWSDDANRQLSAVLKDLIARGCTIFGYDNEEQKRILGIETT